MVLTIIPADEIRINPPRPTLRLPKLTGTGRAHPNPTKKSISVPTGSRCLSGLRLNRPIILAVGSPIRQATHPWASSCRITEYKRGTAIRAKVSGSLIKRLINPIYSPHRGNGSPQWMLRQRRHSYYGLSYLLRNQAWYRKHGRKANVIAERIGHCLRKKEERRAIFLSQQAPSQTISA